MTEIVLETMGLTKYYGGRLAVDHLDLKVPRGCICGFLGRNGAGKTTAIKMLLGLLEPTAGSARVLGCDATALTPSVRQRIGYVTEGHRLFRWMSIGRLEAFQKAFYPKQWDGRFFAEMIEYFGLSTKQKIKDLSNGQRAQVSLALALAPNPELLIMDDPTLGLDAAIRRQFLEGMIELITRQGRTVFFSSHILGDVERVADRLVVIDKGVLRADCSLEQFRTSVRKVVLHFDRAVPAEVGLEGVVQCRRGEKQMELTLVGAGDAEIAEYAGQAAATRYDFVEMNLEDQFIEFTAPPNHRRLFQWEEK
jgi:ABC-2 type transport system ATP-binding protein